MSVPEPIIERTVDAVVVGSGPAGCTAALYLTRAGFSTVMIAGEQPGGALTTTTLVENFPGFPEGIEGPELMDRMRRQVAAIGAEIIPAPVDRIELPAGGGQLLTVGDAVFRSRAVVLATGSVARTLGVPGESELTGRGVSTCATCDGFFFRGRRVAVVGGGDSAMEEALTLARIAAHVTLLHRSDHFRASAIMLERVRNHPSIKVVTGARVSSVLGDDRVVGIRVEREDGPSSRLDVDGLFVAVGHDPRTDLVTDGTLAAHVRIRPDGTLHTSGLGGALELDGVFACGDLVDNRYRQAIFAAGSGCAAALEAAEHLARVTVSEVAA